MKPRHWWMLALALLAYGLLVIDQARATVRVSVTPDAAVVEARTATGYTITYSADRPATIRPWFYLPGHGLPCGQEDTPGEPVGNDPDTNFVVLTGGLVVSGRTVLWPDSVHLDAGEQVTRRLEVLTAPLGGCFYAGASAFSSDPVIGLARGAGFLNDQANELGTGGEARCATIHEKACTLDWWMANGTDVPATVVLERFGARRGFSLVDDSIGDAHKLSHGTVWQWDERITIPPHERIERRVDFTRPCGERQALLRLHIERDDGFAAGTGDGVPIKLARCGAVPAADFVGSVVPSTGGTT